MTSVLLPKPGRHRLMLLLTVLPILVAVVLAVTAVKRAPKASAADTGFKLRNQIGQTLTRAFVTGDFAKGYEPGDEVGPGLVLNFNVIQWGSPSGGNATLTYQFAGDNSAIYTLKVSAKAKVGSASGGCSLTTPGKTGSLPYTCVYTSSDQTFHLMKTAALVGYTTDHWLYTGFQATWTQTDLLEASSHVGGGWKQQVEFGPFIVASQVVSYGGGRATHLTVQLQKVDIPTVISRTVSPGDQVKVTINRLGAGRADPSKWQWEILTRLFVLKTHTWVTVNRSLPEVSSPYFGAGSVGMAPFGAAGGPFTTANFFYNATLANYSQTGTEDSEALVLAVSAPIGYLAPSDLKYDLASDHTQGHFHISWPTVKNGAHTDL